MLESDACDELACLTKKMEPNPKPDDKNEFKDIAVDSQPPGCVNEKLSGSKDDVEMEQSLGGPSQGNERSIDRSSRTRELLLPIAQSHKIPSPHFHHQFIIDFVTITAFKCTTSDTISINIHIISITVHILL
ncbi:unnamed protein product [Lupinus luteus]|uniref:Uncharacterized protein n=1 Tax=Lupinus luteus TaxID=3873 RepID=A0AAV1XWC3_LUPLU